MSGLLLPGHLWSISQAATGSLIAAVWQGMLLALIAAVVLRLLPKTPAAVRFAIWFGVFLVVTALPLISLLPHTAIGSRAAGSAWLVIDERWCLAIAAVWAIASLIRAATLVAAALRVRALWKRATPVGNLYTRLRLEGAGTLESAESLEGAGSSKEAGSFERAGLQSRHKRTACNTALAAEGMSGTWFKAFLDVLRPTLDGEAVIDGGPGLLGSNPRRASICVSDEVDRPTVIGFFSPKILIPGWLLEKLTPAELEQVVLHEAGHLGRADDWMNLLQKIALVLFPLNPALAWVERRLCFERELACDERVLHATGAPKAYAACLATLAEYRLERRGLMHGLALALGALGRESELGRRVGRILRRGESMKPAHSRLVLGGAMLALVVGVVGLERCPEVVAFAPVATHGPASYAAIDSAIVSSPHNSSRPYRMQAVVFHVGVSPAVGLVVKQAVPQPGRRELRAAGAASIFGLKPASFSEAEIGAAPVTNRAQPRPHRVETSMPVQRLARTTESGTTGQSGAVNPAAPTLVHWVMVTAWQASDGSRLVMTTEGISNASRRAAVLSQSDEAPVAQQAPQTTQTSQPDPSSAQSAQQSSQQFYPYAAVPVRGGWLIVQM